MWQNAPDPRCVRIERRQRVSRLHSMRLTTFLLLMAFAAPAPAVEVNLIGLFPGKAVVVIGRGAPRRVPGGQRTPEGVLLVSVDSTAAMIEVDGKRGRLEMGRHFETPAQSSTGTTTTMASDERGHFIVDGAINGAHIRFLVDTGATFVALSSQDAQRLGIDYRGGRRSAAVLADGRRVNMYHVKLDRGTIRGLALFVGDGSRYQGRATRFPPLRLGVLG